MSDRNWYHFSLIIIGSLFIAVGSVVLLSEAFDYHDYHGFPIGNLVIITRGETKYVGSFDFSFFNDGWVRVQYRYSDSRTIGQVMFPVKVGDIFDVDDFYGLRFKFQVLDAGDTYIVLKRLA